MFLSQIIAAIIVLVLFRLFFWPKSKHWLLFILSLIAVYWFQTPSSIRTLGFWLPTILLFFSVFSWIIFTRHEKINKPDNVIALFIILLFPFIFYLFKQFGFSFASQISNMPNISYFVLITGVLALFLFWLYKNPGKFSVITALMVFTLILFLVILKNQTLSKHLSSFLRQFTGQSTSLASSFDIAWVGFSYFTFRLIHALVERERLNRIDISLRDFVTYLIFFPAFTAGPIDRLDRFASELNKPEENSLNDDFVNGGMRIIKGLFQKFILADSLALISLNSYSANLVTKSEWLWIGLYAYAFRIFFDFSGYTDIAIGISRLAGITLPENFKRPYLSKNITQFWNNWHITMTQWFRTYYFNPVTRYFRSKNKNISPAMLIMAVQISTMVLIGLWHGISWNFVMWGLWNGIGLFIHNRWSEVIMPKLIFLSKKPFANPYSIFSMLLTFNFIALGWVWFSLPSLAESLMVFSKLF